MLLKDYVKKACFTQIKSLKCLSCFPSIEDLNVMSFRYLLGDSAYCYLKHLKSVSIINSDVLFSFDLGWINTQLKKMAIECTKKVTLNTAFITPFIKLRELTLIYCEPHLGIQNSSIKILHLKKLCEFDMEFLKKFTALEELHASFKIIVFCSDVKLTTVKRLRMEKSGYENMDEAFWEKHNFESDNSIMIAISLNFPDLEELTLRYLDGTNLCGSFCLPKLRVMDIRFCRPVITLDHFINFRFPRLERISYWSRVNWETKLDKDFIRMYRFAGFY